MAQTQLYPEFMYWLYSYLLYNWQKAVSDLWYKQILSTFDNETNFSFLFQVFGLGFCLLLTFTGNGGPFRGQSYVLVLLVGRGTSYSCFIFSREIFCGEDIKSILAKDPLGFFVVGLITLAPRSKVTGLLAGCCGFLASLF